MINLWKNLSVSKKLYSLVGIMAFLITTELLTLLFAMNTLSAVRAFVGGEGMWSKAQKDAVQALQRYAETKSGFYFLQYSDYIKIPLGDNKARNELSKEYFNYDIVRSGFVEGKNHPDDVASMVKLIRRFHKVSYLADAIAVWGKADVKIFEMIDLADDLHLLIQGGKYNPKEVKSLLDRIEAINAELTILEDQFSSTLGEASRWLENLLMWALVLAVLTIEGGGLILTFTFSRRLNQVLTELNAVTQKVGDGDFNQIVQVQSKDELGQLALSINHMTAGLRRQTQDRQIAEHASQAKNLFLANMSHEIRTPLNAILGFTELLRDPHLTDSEKRDYFNIVNRTGHNLTTLLNDILDITKIEAHQIEIKRSVFSLTQIISDLKALMQHRCEEKGIILTFTPRGEISEFIDSDPVRLRQILINLIGNAIKFTQRGAVGVTYEVLEGRLVFYVTDTGVGISSQQASKLFVPFSQGDQEIQKKFGGTGLGLFLSQKLANLLGGNVGLLDSQVTKGSTFFASINYIEASEDQMHIKKPNIMYDDLQGKSVLLVEDTPDNQMLIKLFLGRTGIFLDFADNGAEAISKILQKKYDLILMDMQMPVMDGYTATSEIRKLGYKTPIVALTGHAMKEDRAKCLAVGCDEYLTKPVDKSQLLDIITKATAKARVEDYV